MIKFSALRMLIVDDVTDAVCIIKACGLSAFVIWSYGAIKVAMLSHPNLNEIAHSASTIIGVLSVSLFIKSKVRK